MLLSLDTVPVGQVMVATLGYSLFGAVALTVYNAIVSGRLVTRREADMMQRIIDKQQETIDNLIKQNSTLLVKDANAVISS